MTTPLSDERFAEIRRLVAGGALGTRDLAELLAEAERLRGIEADYDRLKEHNGVGWHRATQLTQLIDEVAIPSLRYCETRYGHDDMARLNFEAGVTETLCFGLNDEQAANLRQIRAQGPSSQVLDDATPGSPS